MSNKTCPNGEYLFDSILKTNTGAYRCKVQGLQPEDANCRTYDYPVCHQANHEECSLFLLKKLEKLIESA